MEAREPATAPMYIPRADEPRRRRRGGGIAFVVILVLLIAVAVAGEFAARAVVQDQVRDRVVNQLQLPEDHPVDVGLSGIVLVQLLSGQLDEVRLSSDDVPVAGLAVDAEVALTQVPVRDGADAGPGTAQLRLDAATVEQLLAQAPLPGALAGSAVALAEPDLLLSREYNVLGSAVAVEIAVTPGAADGNLTFEPTGARLGDLDLALDQLSAVIGMSAEPTSVCLADRYPAGITLTGVAVEGDDLVVDASVAAGTLADPALQQPGACG